jgi:hypothetical protein
VLILTPLAVGPQTQREAAKFDIEAHRSQDGTGVNGIVITNYERLHYFDPEEAELPELQLTPAHLAAALPGGVWEPRG